MIEFQLNSERKASGLTVRVKDSQQPYLLYTSNLFVEKQYTTVRRKPSGSNASVLLKAIYSLFM